ncbi:MAG: type I secretion C-terminal target domain-containing protein, partial [Burkholderiales bacterium]|nr:type I secretion C-terminal target domain-containing protein [Burkholderiales bacterium]
PRLLNVEIIDMGAGDDVVDLTSTVYAYGDVTLLGGSGNDVLWASSGNDRLQGGSGNDTLDGGWGSDTFVWTLADAGTPGTPAVDTVSSFNTAASSSGGDILDLRDLLAGENANTSSLVNYLHFEKSGSDTIIHISSSGGFSGDSHNVGGSFSSAQENQIIVLQGIDLIGTNTTDATIIQNLLNGNKLMTD